MMTIDIRTEEQARALVTAARKKEVFTFFGINYVVYSVNVQRDLRNEARLHGLAELIEMP